MPLTSKNTLRIANCQAPTLAQEIARVDEVFNIALQRVDLAVWIGDRDPLATKDGILDNDGKTSTKSAALDRKGVRRFSDDSLTGGLPA